jgi:hypothetical protein
MKPKKMRKIVKQINKRIKARGLDRIQIEHINNYGVNQEANLGCLLEMNSSFTLKSSIHESNFRGYRWLNKTSIKKIRFSFINKEGKIIFDMLSWKDALDPVFSMMLEVVTALGKSGVELTSNFEKLSRLKNDKMYRKVELGTENSQNEPSYSYSRKKKSLYFISSDYEEPEDDEEEEDRRKEETFQAGLTM